LTHLVHGHDGRRDTQHPRDAQRGGVLEHRGRSPAAHASGRHTDTCAFSLERTGRRRRGNRAPAAFRRGNPGPVLRQTFPRPPATRRFGRDRRVRVARLALAADFEATTHKRLSLWSRFAVSKSDP
jgi:hypothetical protein